MSMKMPYAAQLDTEAQMLNGFINGCYMALLGSSISVGTGTTLTNCTAAEAAFTGYARATMTGWTVPATDGSGRAASTATALFTPTGSGGSGNIYGYFLTDSGGTFFYGVEVFSTPINAPQNVQVAIALTYLVVSLF